MALLNPNCSVPGIKADTAIYVTSPNIRGTLDILWSCWTIILLCTWTIQHLNVPVHAEPKSWRQLSRRTVYIAVRKIKWMVLTLLAPEFMLGKGFADLMSAQWNAQKMKDLAECDGVEWSRQHSFFANMGGFVIEFSSEPENGNEEIISDRGDNEEDTKVDKVCLPPFSTDCSGENLQNPLSQPTSGVASMSPVSPKTSCVPMKLQQAFDKTDAEERSATHLLRKAWLSETDRSTLRPTAQDLEARQAMAQWLNKGNRLTHLFTSNAQQAKAIGEINWPVSHYNSKLVQYALAYLKTEDTADTFQYAWACNLLVLQGQRWMVDCAQLRYTREVGIIEKLPILSTIELDDKNKGDALVKTIAVCQVFWLILQLIGRLVEDLAVSQLEVYVFALSSCSFVNYLLLWDKPQDVSAPITITAKRYPTIAELREIATLGPRGIPLGGRKRHLIPNDHVHVSGTKDPTPALVVSGAVAAVMFGALHLIAWNFEFPTQPEKVLWRVAAIATMSVPIFAYICDTLIWVVYVPKIATGAGRLTIVSKVLDSAKASFLLAYGLARLYVLVEVTRTLFYLPPSAFVATWSTNIPHVG